MWVPLTLDRLLVYRVAEKTEPNPAISKNKETIDRGLLQSKRSLS